MRNLTAALQGTSLALSWGVPFSLDIRDEDPDIRNYLVHVVNITSSTTLASANITVTDFTYPIPPKSWCFITFFTVTPVNVVGEGVSNTLAYFATDNRK